jgi:uncharacterized glyoxalase superfamily protein PhnB
MHVHLYVNGGSLMLSDAYRAWPPGSAPRRRSTHLQVDDVERWWKRGRGRLRIVSPLQVMFWGDRYGQLRDPFGVLWALASPAETA